MDRRARALEKRLDAVHRHFAYGGRADGVDDDEADGVVTLWLLPRIAGGRAAKAAFRYRIRGSHDPMRSSVERAKTARCSARHDAMPVATANP